MLIKLLSWTTTSDEINTHLTNPNSGAFGQFIYNFGGFKFNDYDTSKEDMGKYCASNISRNTQSKTSSPISCINIVDKTNEYYKGP